MQYIANSEIYFFQEDIIRALQRNGLKLEDALSFDKVKNNLSMRDMAKMCALPMTLRDLSDFGIQADAGASLLYLWSDSTNEEVKDKMNTIRAFIDEGSVKIEIRDDLTSNRIRGIDTCVEPFHVKPFGDRKIAIIISNGALSDPQKNEEISRNLVKAMVKGLCIYQEYGTVLQGSLGLRYLNQLFN